MSLGEEPDEPNTGDERHAAGEPAETSSPLAVIISGDGSATIDGVPVPVVGEEPVDTAILDTLHGYARSRNAPVAATISDPGEGYVVIVEVAPDGSSRLLEQHEEEPDADETREFAVSGPYPGPSGLETDALDMPGALDAPDGTGIPDIGDIDDEPDPTSRPVQPALTTPASVPAPSPDLDRGSSRRKQLDQSDDEYEPPGLLKRPLFVGAAGIALAAVVVVPLMMIATPGGGAEKGRATGAAQSPSAPSDSASTSTSPSASRSSSASPSASRSPSASPSASKSTPPKPTEIPKTEVDPETHKGAVFINNKYDFCVDLPGPGNIAPDTKVQDAACERDDNQEWVLNRVSQGGDSADLYLIRNTRSGLCLDLPYYGPAPAGKRVGVFHCDGSKEDNQLWRLHKRSGGGYWIRNSKSGDMCLDVARTSKEGTKNAVVMISKCDEAGDQQWGFFTS